MRVQPTGNQPRQFGRQLFSFGRRVVRERIHDGRPESPPTPIHPNLCLFGVRDSWPDPAGDLISQPPTTTEYIETGYDLASFAGAHPTGGRPFLAELGVGQAASSVCVLVLVGRTSGVGSAGIYFPE